MSNFFFVYGSEQLFSWAMLFDDPQGMVLGTLLCILYTAQLFEIIKQHWVNGNAHQYDNNLQLYLYIPPAEASIATDRLDACHIDVEAWLKVSQLRLNPSKTQVMWLGSAQRWPRYRLMKFQYCHLKSRSLILRKTLVSLLIVSCQCQHILQQSVVTATISYGNCGHSREALRMLPSKP